MRRINSRYDSLALYEIPASTVNPADITTIGQSAMFIMFDGVDRH